MVLTGAVFQVLKDEVCLDVWYIDILELFWEKEAKVVKSRSEWLGRGRP